MSDNPSNESTSSRLWSQLVRLAKPLYEPLLGPFTYLWYSGFRVPWLIAYNVAGAALLLFFFAVTSQGKDILRIAADNPLWTLLLLAGALVASVTFWYTSRLLLGRDYPGYPLPHPYADFGRRWWPRVVGVVVPLAIGLTYNEIAAEPGGGWPLLGWLYLAIAAALLAFYILRRRLFGISPEYMVETPTDDIPPADRRRGRRLLLGAFALLLLFMIMPALLPQLLGAPAIAVIGVAAISLFGSAFLTYAPMRKGWPALTLAALLLAWLFGIFNDNHAVRTAGDAGDGSERQTPAERYAAWQQAGGGDPAIFVTASGGGIRAAYWTASTLAYLEQMLGTDFSDRLVAISGVSGGSVGAATYVTLKRAQLDAGDSGSLLDPARDVLREDFLSPVVAGLLFPDLAQRFVPVPVTLADRQRFLERSWEAAFDGAAHKLFHGPFQALYRGENGKRLPSLLLNTTVVETGQRAVVSDLKVGGLPDVLDLLEPRYRLEAIRTSAAAGASARFTYVSPAGRVDLTDGKHLRVVDGGYFENSGAATMGDLLAMIENGGARLKPVLLMIRNSLTAPPLCRRDSSPGDAEAKLPVGDDFNATISEVAAPIEVLFATREGRERVDEVKTARLVETMGGVVIEMPLAAVLEVRLEALEQAVEGEPSPETLAEVTQPYLEPPLGWSLSEEVRRGMDETLDNLEGGLAKQVEYLKQALRGEPVPPCDPM